MKGKTLVFFAALVALLTSIISCDCKEDTPPTPANDSAVKVIIELFNGANPMVWNEIVSLDSVNEFRMEFFKFYLSNISAVNSKGDVLLLKDVVIADASEANGMVFTFAAPSGAYDKLTVGVGLDAVLNAKDPVSFSPEEPLSAAQAMYWSWATKYRFIRIDARANQNGTIGSANDILVAYHPGADALYAERDLAKPFNLITGATTEFRVKLDVAAFFNGPAGIINIPTEPQSHTTPDDYALAQKFTTNFIAALEPM